MTMTLQDSPHRRTVGRPVTLAVLHPKGGVGRSTTVWHLGAELALRGRRVVLEDLDQGVTSLGSSYATRSVWRRSSWIAAVHVT